MTRKLQTPCLFSLSFLSQLHGALRELLNIRPLCSAIHNRYAWLTFCECDVGPDAATAQSQSLCLGHRVITGLILHTIQVLSSPVDMHVILFIKIDL
jgi:hypothetical protein